jgi:hypothetical protein
MYFERPAPRVSGQPECGTVIALAEETQRFELQTEQARHQTLPENRILIAFPSRSL